MATDAYGYIKFEESSSKPAPYIRISSDADQEQWVFNLIKIIVNI